jgi:phage gp46-like protein
MAGLDRKIDPVTKDYIADGFGGFETTTTIAPAAYHQLVGKRGFWWGNPDQGSDLHLIANENISQKTFIFAKNAIATAMQMFIDQRRARDLTIDIDSPRPGYMTIESQITDTQGGVIDVSGLASLR